MGYTGENSVFQDMTWYTDMSMNTLDAKLDISSQKQDTVLCRYTLKTPTLYSSNEKHMFSFMI